MFKLADLLDQRQMTMYQLSKKTGIRPNTLSQWVNNAKLQEEDKHVKAISVEVLNLMCEALDCTPGDLLEYTPDDDNVKSP
ncbi:helix-turn-helix transcriptional regulator [Paenibacillus sp. MZ04-78.2]|uniref:helix-turn-helix domain-containing protein n=1 Tax=Paenibacillus sp. MZ04-78.2 TaxID=2962034 RepID=UPI0020B8051C|nr:helix-turn-helix transcriptional regulator [Paenibacillus sp. MZ04-78.2]MCP3775185.1 helix-turn-helix transcriptional regulator [Paenibacillus sp. MZ04-78.2]